MDNNLETLEQQTAPESTRGLFDTPEPKNSLRNSLAADKRRSFHVFGPGIESTKIRQQAPTQRGHQRSRSAITPDMLSNQNARRNFGLQTLTEENDDSHKARREDAEQPVTVDSLHDIINTLKSLPPIVAKEDNRRSSIQRKPQSMSALNFGPQTKRLSFNAQHGAGNGSGGGGAGGGNMLQNTVHDLRSMDDKSERRRSLRARSIGDFDDEGYMSREAALAEAEAKLMGTYRKETPNSDDAMDKASRRHSSSRFQTLGYEDEIRRPTSRRFSDATGSFDVTHILPPQPSKSTSKRMSLQLPTLSENSNESTASRTGRRIQFNKPLDLSGSEDRRQQNRRSSRNFDYDWRASASPIHQSFSSNRSSTISNRSSFNLVPFTPTRVNFARDDANPHQRRHLFIAHLPLSALPPLLRSRQLLRGTLRVNKRNRSDAYVSCDELDADIYVCGSRDRNRALEGDVVVIRLVDVEKVLREKREKEEAKLARNGGQVRVRLPDEEDENEIIFGGDDDIDAVKPKYCGVVVHILERAQNQVFSGALTLMRPNNKRAQEEKAADDTNSQNGKKDPPRIVWFKAADKRVPLIAIPIEQAPAGFVENNEAYANRLFVGAIKRWPITSLHPFGTLERELGHINELSVQTMAILADNNVTDTEFSEQVNECLPTMPFEVGETVSDDRRNLINVRTFTLDPAGSNVLDDAISVQQLGDDTYEIGVHISDVAYFIKPHSALDKEARARAVRVDLLHKAVPMLPTSLTEQVTNLVPGKSKFAFSVIWKMNSEGKILDTWFGKTIIRSCAQLTYDDAQKVVEGGNLSHAIKVEEQRIGVEKDIRTLHAIANQLYETRRGDDTMFEMRDELEYTFDEHDQEIPTGVAIHKKKEGARVIKEFLLLANLSVAQKVSSSFPEQALLRRQAPPLSRKIVELQDYVSRYLGVGMDVSSAGGIQRSIDRIDDPMLKRMVSIIVLKTLQPPKYFCTGTLDILKYSHYALGAPLFTHFTAPSRRFSDIIVHRQLDAVLSGEKRFYLDRDTVQKLAQHCNVKKEAALNARHQSNMLFLSLHLNKLINQSSNKVAYYEGIVVATFDQFFDIMVPEINMEKRIHLANLPVWRHDFDERSRALTMFWKKEVVTTGVQHTYSMSDDEYDDYDEDALLSEMQADVKTPSTASPTSSVTGASVEHIVTDLSVQQQQQEQQRQQQPLSQYQDTVRSPSPTATLSTPSKANKRRSIISVRLSKSSGYNFEQASQTIKAMDKIRVIVTVETVRTPPLIRVLAANPFA